MANEKSCDWCVFRDKKNPAICKNCSYNEPITPRFELGKVDPFKLGKLLAEKQKREQQLKEAAHRYICPECKKPTVVYNNRDDTYDCLTQECNYRFKLTLPHNEAGEVIEGIKE